MRCGDGSRVTRNVQVRNSFLLEKTRRKQHRWELKKIQGRGREVGRVRREERREHEKDVKRRQCVMRFGSLGNALCLEHQKLLIVAVWQQE